MVTGLWAGEDGPYTHTHIVTLDVLRFLGQAVHIGHVTVAAPICFCFQRVLSLGCVEGPDDP